MATWRDSNKSQLVFDFWLPHSSAPAAVAPIAFLFCLFGFALPFFRPAGWAPKGACRRRPTPRCLARALRFICFSFLFFGICEAYKLWTKCQAGAVGPGSSSSSSWRSLWITLVPTLAPLDGNFHNIIACLVWVCVCVCVVNVKWIMCVCVCVGASACGMFEWQMLNVNWLEYFRSALGRRETDVTATHLQWKGKKEIALISI